ncbi:MAG: hypothetical protein WCT22_03730 [Patescibacteria group bacterium]
MKLYSILRPYLLIIAVVLISTIVLWLPFLLKSNGLSFLDIYKHYDGPLYVIPAKTFYNPSAIEKLHIEIKLPTKYFAAHLPLYPILIRTSKELIQLTGLRVNGLEYLKSMIGVNILATIGLVLFFYFFLNKFKLTKKPIILASVMLFLPRFLVIRSVGAPESLFILLILMSLFFFEENKFWLAGLFGGLATMTKAPGILLFAGYGLVFIERLIKIKKFNWNWIGTLLIPLGLLIVFGIYSIQYGDFFAFFHGNASVPMPYIFSVFNWKAKWVGTAWLEDILFYFFMYGLTVVYLKDSKYRSFFYFSLVFFVATIFIQHRDISRYSLPLWPLALIAFEKFFTSKKFLIIFLILLPAIFLYAWSFLSYNVMPISDWAAFL